MYGALPFAISALMGIFSLSAGANPETFNLNNPVASNPAYFMDMAGNKFFYTLASALDVFTIWCHRLFPQQQVARGHLLHCDRQLVHIVEADGCRTGAALLTQRPVTSITDVP